MRGRLGPGAPVVVLALAAGGFGCGHDVEPAPGFSDPASIPLCCAGDPGPSCCALEAFPFVNGVALDWNSEDRIFAFIDGWNLYRAEGSGEPADTSFRRVNGALILDRSYVDPDVIDGADYWYRLASLSPAGVESRPTPAVPVRADMTPPGAPSGLRAAAVEVGEVRLVWDANPEPDLDHYDVFRDPALPPSVFFSVPREEFLDRTVTAGTTYRYWLRAVDHGLNVSAAGETLAVAVPGP